MAGEYETKTIRAVYGGKSAPDISEDVETEHDIYVPMRPESRTIKIRIKSIKQGEPCAAAPC